MTTKEPLLPCPFCGAKMAMRGDYTHDHAWNFYTHEDREERDNCILSQYEIPCGPDFTTPAKSLADAWNRRAMPLQDHAGQDSEQWALLYLHDWDPPREGQEHKWQPGLNVFPEIHGTYATIKAADQARAKMSDPNKYWVRRSRVILAEQGTK